MRISITGTRKFFDNKENSIVADSLKNLPSILFIATYAFIIAIVYTRIFKAAEYGQYSFYIALAGPIITISAEWVAQPVLRYYADYKNSNTLEHLWHALTTFIFGITAFFMIVGIVLWIVFHGNINTSSIYYVIPTFFIIVLQSLTSTLLPIFPSSFKAQLWRNITAFTPILATIITLILINFSGKYAFYILYGQAISLALFLPLIVFLSGWKPKISQILPSDQSKATMLRMSKYGIPMMVWFMSSSILDIEDRLLLHWFRSERELGIYAVSYSMMSGVVMLLNLPINVAIGPVLYNYWSKGKKQEAAAAITEMSRMYIYLASVLAITVALFGPSLLSRVLGQDYREGINIIIPIMLARMAWGVSMIGQKTLELNEKTKRLMYLSLRAAVINTVLNLIFIPSFGIYAASFSTLFCYVLYCYLVYNSSKNIMPWKIEFSSITIPIFTSMIVITLYYALSAANLQNLYVSIIIEIVSVAVIFMAFFKSKTGV